MDDNDSSYHMGSRNIKTMVGNMMAYGWMNWLLLPSERGSFSTPSQYGVDDDDDDDVMD
jgi:hypothetical protein